MADAAFTIKWLVHTCALCGAKSPSHVSVLGAAGSYCKDGCSTFAVACVGRHQREHFARALAHGVIRIPAPLWSPTKRA